MSFAFHSPGSADGWLRPLDARWKLVGFAIFLAAVFSLVRLETALAAFVGCVVAAVTAEVSTKRLAMRVGVVALMIAVFFGMSLFWRQDPTVLAVLLLKIATLTAALVALVDSTPLPELGQGAAGLGTPRLFVHLVLLTDRYVFVIADEFVRLRRALRVRGYVSRLDRRGFATIGQVIGTLFVRGHERAERVHHAMAARGFDGVFRSLSSSTTRLADVLFVALAVLAAATLVTLDRGWLT